MVLAPGIAPARSPFNAILKAAFSTVFRKFKGAAFVEFDSKEDADRACRLNGTAMGGSDRRLRINPASNKPAGR